MKLTFIALLIGVCLAVCTGPVVAAAISYEENWDTYAPGTADSNYVANWPTIPDAQRYPVEDEVDSPNRQNSPPNSLGVGKDTKYGITHDLTADALSPGGSVFGTDANPLEALIFIDAKAVTATDPRTLKMDAFLEISLGGAHAPDSIGMGPEDAIAFGFTYGINGDSIHPYIYDGLDWIEATGVTSGKRWNLLRLEITSTQLTLTGERNAIGNWTIPRNYTGGFDSISVRTEDNDDLGQKRWIDDILFTGGEISGMPDADFDTDGDVDGDDFLTWQTGFGSGTSHAEGDANNDGEVDGIDLEIWQNQFGSVGAGSFAAVPEPAAATLLLIMCISCVVSPFARF